MKQEAIEKLEQAVSTKTCGCALERLSSYLEDKDTRLSELATSIGFTKAEAFGIMDGWDTSDGRQHPLFEDDFDSFEYKAGVELGKKLFTVRLR